MFLAKIFQTVHISQSFHLSIKKYGRNGSSPRRRLKPIGLSCGYSDIVLCRTVRDTSHKIPSYSPSDISDIYTALCSTLIGFFSFSHWIFCADMPFFVDVPVKAYQN